MEDEMNEISGFIKREYLHSTSRHRWEEVTDEEERAKVLKKNRMSILIHVESGTAHMYD